MKEHEHEKAQERRSSRRGFLKTLGTVAGVHFVLLNNWVFAAASRKRPRLVEEDLTCGQEGNYTKPSATFEDRDCGKLDLSGAVHTDEDCGKQSPHVYPGNATWWDNDCGKRDPAGNVLEDQGCGLSRAGYGGANADYDCGKSLSPSSPYFSSDSDCTLQTGALGVWTDKDCNLPDPRGGIYEDSLATYCRLFW